MKRNNRGLLLILVAFSFVFISVIGYLVYFQLFKAEDLANNSANRRNFVDEEYIVRGEIFDKYGTVLATNDEDDNGKAYRRQIYPEAYAHLIGYKSDTYGTSGIEKAFNSYLLDVHDKDPISQLRKSITTKSIGNDIELTIDNDLQLKAYDLLKGYKGSIVVIKPSTGEVLAMTSRPSFNTNKITSIWDDLINDNDNSPLINRATNGLYTPGSVMKIVSSVAVLESGVDQDYYDEGKTLIDGYTFSNYNEKAYGEIGLREALIYSANTYFADKSQEIGWKKFKEVSDRFMFNQAIDFDLSVSTSRAPFKSGMGKTELASSSFGQGNVLVSPLNMAMVGASIANDGIMMKPLVVNQILTYDGKVVYKAKKEDLSKVTSVENAQILQEYLRDTVRGKDSIDISGHSISGKTGTAENASGKTHSWFVGFEKDEDIAIAVVLEESGLTGSQGAQPIAGKLFKYYFNK